jgi:hypothetical protein
MTRLELYELSPRMVSLVADGTFATLIAHAVYISVAGKAVPVVSAVYLAYFVLKELTFRFGYFEPLAKEFDGTSANVEEAFARARSTPGLLLVLTRSDRRARELIAAARDGQILSRPLVAGIRGHEALPGPPIPKLPLVPYLPPRLKSLPRDWWNAPELGWKLALVAVLELVYNVWLVEPGHFDGSVIAWDFVRMVALVMFAQFYWYARVDHVLRRVERKAAQVRDAGSA